MIKATNAPDGAILSDTYAVYVKSADTDYKKLDVYTALTTYGDVRYQNFPPEIFKEFDGIEYGNYAKKTYFASFDANEPVEVKIVCSQKADSIKIKPETIDKQFIKDDNSVTFIMSPDEKLVIEVNEELYGSLKLFCNTISTAENDKKNYIEFKPGYYTEENCDYIRINEHGVPVMDCIPDDTTVYLHDGAVVRAAVILKNKHNIKICGRGIISLIERCYGADSGFNEEILYGGFRYWAMPNIYIHGGCSNIDIEGIILNCEFRGITIRNCDNISITNVKMFTSCVNADGINAANTRKMLIKDCYIQSADDCVAIYTACDSIPTLADKDCETVIPISSDIEVCDCLLITSARHFMIGGHATGSTNPHDLVENISCHDIEIIDIASVSKERTIEHARYWSGILRILSQTEQYVRNISFENININWTKGYIGKAVHIEVRNDKTASYTEKRGYRIENITFENINIFNCPETVMESVILSDFGDQVNDNGYGINGIHFKNFTYNNKTIEYKPNYIVTSGKVADIAVS